MENFTDSGLFMDPSQVDEADSTLSSGDMLEVIILLVMALISIVGNSLVVSVYTGAEGQHTNASLYILNLAAADLITLGIIVVLEISELFGTLWPIIWRHDIQCQLYRIGRFTCIDITVFLMMDIAIDRYMAVVHPLHYKRKYTNRRTKYVLAFLWVAAGLLATPVGLNFTTNYNKAVQGPSYGVCAIGTIFVVNGINLMGAYISLIQIFIPALTTGIIYTSLVIYVRRHNTEFATKAHYTDRIRTNHWKMAKVLLTVYFGYVICYSPYLLFFLSQYIDRSLLSKAVRQIFLTVPYANSCINPVIYLSMSRSFRAKLLEKFSRGGVRGEVRNRPPVDTPGHVPAVTAVSNPKSDVNLLRA